MLNSSFKIIYLIGFILAFLARKIQLSRYGKNKVSRKDTDNLDILFLILVSIGMILPLIYVFTDILDFADFYSPEWIAWIGVAMFAIAIFMIWKSHADLSTNWSVSIVIKAEHQLITTGIYKYIRHPMYAAHILWAISQSLILHNWIAGFSFLIAIIPQYLYRKSIEEKALTDKFGQRYIDYKRKTGSIIPKF